LRRRVELFAELHDVDALLTKRGTDRRRGIRLSRRNLQFNNACDWFACHMPSLLGALDLPVL